MPLTSSNTSAVLLRDMVRLALSAGLVQGVALLALPLLQRWFYGPEAFAEFSLYSQWAGLFGAIATLRMDLAVVQHSTERMARAAWQNGLMALLAVSLASAALAAGLDGAGWAMGRVPGLCLWLPLGVGALGLGSLATATLSRDRQFASIARLRASGGTLGEALRFASAGMGHSGLIAGRVAGQWWTAIGAVRRVRQSWTTESAPRREDRKAAWRLDRDYVRFTTPANLLAMAANALLLLFLFEKAPPDFVGQVGAALAYLTVAAGLVIRSVSDVFFRHLKEVRPQDLRALYVRWSAGLLLASGAGISLLFAFPDEWGVALLGDRWRRMWPAMRWLSLWMPLWISASALSGIFPHLRRQSWAFGLDVVHLALVAFWMWTWSEAPADVLASNNWTLLKEYAGLQGGFYALAMAVGIHLCGPSRQRA